MHRTQIALRNLQLVAVVAAFVSRLTCVPPLPRKTAAEATAASNQRNSSSNSSSNTTTNNIISMLRDYVQELQLHQQLLANQAKCHIRNRQRVNELITAIVEGGPGRLQIVSDFDRTITKQHENGKIHLSSFGIFARCKSLPETYLEDDKKLTAKYLPIEVNPNIPLPEKKVLMEEWWNLSEKLLTGLSVTEKDLEEVVCEVAMSLRDKCVSTFQLASKHNIPLLVFSAGIGDVVVAVLKHYGVLYPNVKVVSNFLKRNEHGKIEGFDDKTINVFNKNEMVLHGTPYYDMIAERHNVIVMGDSIGDAGMADGLPNCNAKLKIGFLYDHAAGNLPGYTEHFDIVLEDDQSMNVLHSILELVVQTPPATPPNTPKTSKTTTPTHTDDTSKSDKN